MHKIFFNILVLLITSNLAFAQSSQLKTANNSLAKLQKSITDKADIKKQLTIIGEGIKAVEIAEKDRKTKNWPETWAIKAYLCSYVALIDDNETNAEKYFLAAKGALTSAQKLDKFQSNTELIQAAEHNIYVKMQEKGTVAFQQNDFITAYELLKSVSDFMPADTLLATNVAVCAQNLQQYNDALTYFLKAIQNGAKNPLLFQNIANIYTSKFENELAIKTLEEGLSLNANHPQLTNDYINILLDNEQYEKATNAVETSLKIDKQNKLLFFLYGYLYQNRGNTNTAELSYKKALEIDYNYFEALYQLALAYIQEANEALKQKNNKKFTANINRAEYSLLRAHDLNINHKNTMKLLVEIYTRKNKLDKVQELKRKLNEF